MAEMLNGFRPQQEDELSNTALQMLGSTTEITQVLDKIGGDGWTLSDTIFVGTRSVAAKILSGTYVREITDFPD